jgi:acyl carrier protein
VLADHPGVKGAVVIADKDRWDNARLIAYFAPRSHCSPTIGSLRDFLKAKLPDYMVPSMFVALTEFPLTGTGKVDRRALPEPGNSRPPIDTPYVAPRTPMEQQVGQIWSETLSLDQVGIHDNFFDLGGHSLAATRVVSQVIKHFQVDLPLGALFEAPTVAEMAVVIAGHQEKKLGAEELNRILTELEGLSDEEAESQLASESTPHRKGDRDA